MMPNIAKGFFDGIELMDDTHLLISDWVTFPVKGFGKFWIYDLKTQTSKTILSEESPADIFYDRNTFKIYIPQMLHNRVEITSVEGLIKNSNNLNAIKYDRVYQYGLINAFLGGLYKGTLPIAELKFKGDFGLGAPDMVNGELTMNNGKMYQTTYTGETKEIFDSAKTSMAFVSFFKADTSFRSSRIQSKEQALKYINSLLANKNGMYSIRISGMYDYIKTRAFSPVEKNPSPALSTLLKQQHFFEFRKTQGVLVGYKLADFMNGINIPGYHFHFISDGKEGGGHVIDLTWNNVLIEIQELHEFSIDVPQTSDYRQFDFKNIGLDDLKKVENGGGN